MFSKTCQYAIRACIYIAHQSMEGKRVSLEMVSGKIESPEAFTAKILQKLVKNKIINSVKGPGGGFEVDIQGISGTSLKSIVEAIDGNILSQCSLGLNECSDIQPCPFHKIYKPVKEKMIGIYEKTALFDLATAFSEGETFLKL